MGKFSDSPYFLLKGYFDALMAPSTNKINRTPTLQYTGFIFQDSENFDWNSESGNGFVWSSMSYVTPLFYNTSLLSPKSTIIAKGGYWTELYIKIEVDNDDDGYPDGVGFEKYRFKPISTGYIDENNFYFEIGQTVDFKTRISSNFLDGSEVYFRKDSFFHNWVNSNSDYDEYINPNKMFLYFGKIYSTDDIGLHYKIEFDGLKDYVMRALPQNNRTDRLTKFMEVYWDRVHHKSYNLEKNITTLLDSKEVDITYINYIASQFGISVDENLGDVELREWVMNLPFLLKRKGTYSALQIIYNTFLKNSDNKLNIFERWHKMNVSGIPANYFWDILYESTYSVYRGGCAGDFWYNSKFGAPSTSLHLQDISSSTWNITHDMNTYAILVQCYDSLGERLWPARIRAIGTNQVEVTFNEGNVGVAYVSQGDFTEEILQPKKVWEVLHSIGNEVITGYANENGVLMPSEVKLGTTGTSGTMSYATTGYAMVKEASYTHTQVVTASTWTIEHNLNNNYVVVGFYDENNIEIQPVSQTIISRNKTNVTFNSPVKGIANVVTIPTAATNYILPEYGEWSPSAALPGNNSPWMLTPHYKVEIDLSCQPEGQDYIVNETLMNNLISNWEVVRPVSKYADYSQLIAPLTDFSGTYIDLYSGEYDASLNTKFCTSASIESTNTIGVSLHLQYSDKTEWDFYHNLNTRDVIVKCYDINRNIMIPRGIDVISTSRLKIDMGEAGYSGICYIIAADSTTTFVPSASTIWNIQHNRGTTVISNYVDSQKDETLRPSVTQIINSNRLKTTFLESLTGYSNIIDADDYIHQQTSDSTEWIAYHNFGHYNLVVTFYDDNNEEIQPDSMTLTNPNKLSATFGEPVKGIAVIKDLGDIVIPDLIIFSLSDGYWKIGNSGSNSFNPYENNNLQSTTMEGRNLNIREDENYYYIDFEVPKTLEGMEITEMGIFDNNLNIKFYSYFNTIYKHPNSTLVTHFRILKSKSGNIL